MVKTGVWPYQTPKRSNNLFLESDRFRESLDILKIRANPGLEIVEILENQPILEIVDPHFRTKNVFFRAIHAVSGPPFTNQQIVGNPL